MKMNMLVLLYLKTQNLSLIFYSVSHHVRPEEKVWCIRRDVILLPSNISVSNGKGYSWLDDSPIRTIGHPYDG